VVVVGMMFEILAYERNGKRLDFICMVSEESWHY
jgi:hypothetical protein